MDSSSSNERLIKKLRKGNQEAFKEVYFKYYDKLFGMAKGFQFHFLTPEDFVNETFLHLYQQRHLLKEEVLLDKQLFVMCKHIIINHIHRENKVIPINIETRKLILDYSEDSEDLERMELRKRLLMETISQLPPQQREIYTMHKLDNLSYKEIVAISNLSPKTIANHIYLAQKFIEKKIENL